MATETEKAEVIFLYSPKKEKAEEREIRQRKPNALPPAGLPLYVIEPIPTKKRGPSPETEAE